MTVDFQIEASQVEIEPRNNGVVRVRCSGCYLAEIIEALNENDVLEEIGKDRVKSFFDLKESDE